MSEQRKVKQINRPTKQVIVFGGIHRATVGEDQRLPFPKQLWSQVTKARISQFILTPWFHGRLRLFVLQEWERLLRGLGQDGFPSNKLDKAWDFMIQWASYRRVSPGGKIYLPVEIYQSYFSEGAKNRLVFLLGRPGAIDICPEQDYNAERDRFFRDDEVEEKFARLLAGEGMCRPFSGVGNGEST